MGLRWRSGSEVGPLDHGMEVWTTVDVCTLIKNLILGSRAGFFDGPSKPWHEGLGPGCKSKPWIEI